MKHIRLDKAQAKLNMGLSEITMACNKAHRKGLLVKKPYIYRARHCPLLSAAAFHLLNNRPRYQVAVG